MNNTVYTFNSKLKLFFFEAFKNNENLKDLCSMSLFNRNIDRTTIQIVNNLFLLYMHYNCILIKGKYLCIDKLLFKYFLLELNHVFNLQYQRYPEDKINQPLMIRPNYIRHLTQSIKYPILIEYPFEQIYCIGDMNILRTCVDKIQIKLNM